MDYLAQRLIDRGQGRVRIGVEMDNYCFSAKAFEAIVAGLPDETFSDVTALVNWQRAVKSPRELEFMRTAGRFVEKMHQRIFDVIEPGLPKSSLVAEIYDAGLRYDPNIGAGGDYPMSHLQPADERPPGIHGTHPGGAGKIHPRRSRIDHPAASPGGAGG